MLGQIIKGTAALAGALGLFVGLAAPAGAAEIPVSGTFTGTGTLVGGESCPSGQLLGVSSESTGDLTGLGTTDVDLLFCLDVFTGETYTVFGDFTLTAADGSVSGDITGTNDADEPFPGPWPFDLTLTVESGTGDFEGATGVLHSEGDLRPFFTVDGSISGSITVPPNTPSSKDDCMNGGWQDFEDENGDPFPNQGQCIAWVNHNT